VAVKAVCLLDFDWFCLSISAFQCGDIEAETTLSDFQWSYCEWCADYPFVGQGRRKQWKTGSGQRGLTGCAWQSPTDYEYYSGGYGGQVIGDLRVFAAWKVFPIFGKVMKIDFSWDEIVNVWSEVNWGKGFKPIPKISLQWNCTHFKFFIFKFFNPKK
jgi:hypothetical protein